MIDYKELSLAMQEARPRGSCPLCLSPCTLIALEFNSSPDRRDEIRCDGSAFICANGHQFEMLRRNTGTRGFR
jgi:hypothetical protein